MLHTLKFARFVHSGLLISVLGLTGACSTTINIDDENAQSAAAYFKKKTNERVAFGASIVRVNGDAPQTLRESQAFDIGDQNINGPASIDHQFTLDTGRVYTNIKLADTEHISVNLIAGLARTEFELKTLTTDGPNQEILFEDQTTGLTFGAELTIPFNRFLSFKARGLGTNFYVAGNNDAASMIDIEAAAHFDLVEQVSLFAGIYSQNFRNNNYYSDIDIDASGARAGIDFHF